MDWRERDGFKHLWVALSFAFEEEDGFSGDLDDAFSHIHGDGLDVKVEVEDIGAIRVAPTES